MKLRERGLLSLSDGVLILHRPEEMQEQSMLPVTSPARRPLI
jgi:hypothetical protein